MVSSVDSLGDALLHEVCVNNVGQIGCDIIHAVDSCGANGKNCQKPTFGRFIKKTRMKNMCDISHAIHAKCGTTYVTGK